MSNESSIPSGQLAEDDDKFIADGSDHDGDSYSGDNDDPVKVSRPMQILGVLLRFLGMAIIIVSAFGFLILRDHEMLVPFTAGLVGLGMHFAGRKVAPDAHWASAVGGIVAGVVSIGTIVASILFILFILGLVGAVLGFISG